MSAISNVPTQFLTFKYRLLPSQGQHDKLRAALDHTRDLYNAALAERIDCYRKTGKGRSWPAQCKGLTELRADPAWSTYPVTLQRWPLKQVDLAFAAFFRRIKARDARAGFPRFRGREWFKTFGFSDRSGWGVDGKRLHMKGIGSIRLHLHRPLPSTPIACKVKREGRNWYALLTVEIECATRHDRAGVGPGVLNELATVHVPGKMTEFRGNPPSVQAAIGEWAAGADECTLGTPVSLLRRAKAAAAGADECTLGTPGASHGRIALAAAGADEGPAVGIDMGITTLAALSTGELIANARPARRAEREMRRRQRQLARCKRGSKRRRKVKARLASLSAKIARTRETHLHQVSASLTARFGVIVVERLNVKGLGGGMLAREVHDAAWGRLIGMLHYKAARAGGAVIEVDPDYTSQTCPDCGVIKRKELSQRIHRCECGCVLDRDVAAARVILHRAGIGPEAPNAGATRRAPGKMCEAA